MGTFVIVTVVVVVVTAAAAAAAVVVVLMAFIFTDRQSGNFRFASAGGQWGWAARKGFPPHDGGGSGKAVTRLWSCCLDE